MTDEVITGVTGHTGWLWDRVRWVANHHWIAKVVYSNLFTANNSVV